MARFIETLSLHAAVFGVGIVAGAALMLVSVVSRSAVGDWMVPGDGLAGTSGVKTGKAAASVTVLPGAEVHELPGVALPSAGAGAIVPVVLPVTEPRMATGMAGGKVGVALVLVVGAPMLTDTLGLTGVTVMTDGENSAVTGEQFRLVPGIVGSSASAGDASVVTGAPATVAAENWLVNGLGPVSCDDTIAPGVVGSPIAVVPIVDTCARQLLPDSSSTVTPSSVRIAISGVQLSRSEVGSRPQ
ncbi:hypothetical protein [Bradyrhizobium ivorense]|uniref:hypothetical protein n=1 Tax=Bradyrhizobium ivorense TaxID=2511166 RepID=UPI0011160680|nr:hypothetical protein [Bradyrhizobium ivorense]